MDTEQIPTETLWKVTFIGDHFALTTHINASEEDQAIDNASANLEAFYGWDMTRLAYDAEAEDTEQVSRLK